jgi:poly(3-hydroxybutyrate) depolymerase
MFVAIFLLTLLLPALAAGQETGFLRRTVEVGSVTYKYQVYVPASYTPSKKWPVVFFLHGAGERGADGERQTDLGLPARLREMKDFPAIVVMPQCGPGLWWGDPEMEAQAFAALEQSMKELNGDPDRVYLTGLSMGGYGTWAFGYKYPEKFAALVPVCGGVVANRRFISAPPWHPLSKNPEDPYGETASHLTKIPGHGVAQADGSGQGSWRQRTLHGIPWRRSQLVGSGLLGGRAPPLASRSTKTQEMRNPSHAHRNGILRRRGRRL